MTPERWAHARALFESALEQRPGEREQFLHAACEGNEDLLTEVHGLLAAFEKSPGFMAETISPVRSLRGATEYSDALEGSLMGPWKLLRRIGTGGMAAVYAASRIDHEFQKIVALKIVKPGMDSEEILRRFRKERQALASLEHPNIARLLDAGTTDDGRPYLVMEFVEGTPIDTYCDSHRLSISERLSLFRTVCSAVQYAHQNLLVHRDLKPSNILVTAEGVPKLLDFGIAKLLRLEYSGEAPWLTRTQVRPMTPEYASPEQVRGNPITTASDIYSLGVLLYRLLTGELPYRVDGRTTTEIEKAICEQEAALPSAAVAQTSQAPVAEGSREKLKRRLRGDLDVIVMTALRKEPQRRYASVERLSNDIGLHLSGTPVSARKDTWSYRAQKFVARHRPGVLIAAVVALALIVSTAVSAYFGAMARRQRTMTLQLVSFMLEDFDAAMQSGATSARLAATERVLESLQELSPNAAGDRSLQELLVKAYLKIGDLQGNVYESNFGDAAAARQSYRKALDVAHAAGLSREAADANVKLADSDLAAGNRKAALDRYVSARGLFEQELRRQPDQTGVRMNLTRLWYKTGLTQSQLGDLAGALASFRSELEVAETWSKSRDAGWRERRELALAEQHLGDALLNNEDPQGAQQHLQRALDLYQELLQNSPSNTTLQGDIAVGRYLTGEAFAATGKLSASEASYRSSLRTLQRLEEEDPNQQYEQYLNRCRSSLASVLVKLKKTSEAEHITRTLLADLQRNVERSNSSIFDLYEYCWTALNTPFRNLQNPAQVLREAQRAVTLTEGTDPGLLNLLACAYEQNGDLMAALSTGQRAEALLPRQRSSKRVLIQANLDRIQHEISSKMGPAASRKQER